MITCVPDATQAEGWRMEEQVGDQWDAWLNGEPNVEDMLADPIVHLVMRRDGITIETMRAAVRAVRARLNGEPREESVAALGD